MKKLNHILFCLASWCLVLGSATAQTLISEGKPAMSSSNENGGNVASNGNDGNSDTRWSSAHLEGQWWQVDLQHAYYIQRVEIDWENAYSRKYKIESSDNEDFNNPTEIAHITQSIGTQATEVIPINSENAARFLRLTSIERNTPYGTSFWELRVFGSETEDGGGNQTETDSTQLTGTPIGTALSIDYNNGNTQSTSINTIANCFDGDLNTFFASYERSYTWVGLDLDSRHVITKVKYCPRTGQGERLKLGVIEGANNADFSDAVALYIIPSAAPNSQMSVGEINNSKGFRYVRYMSTHDSRCNIAELAFCGYAGVGDNSHIGRLTNIPTVNIHTVNNQEINSKETYIKGIVTVTDNNYYFVDSLDIRGRGNGSWSFPKKPYRMKLKNKAHLLGNPAKERNWTLINNFGDKTLFRNLLAFNISTRMEMPYTPAGRAVDVILNGEYQGTYQLCDHIDKGDGRVEMEKMEATDISLPALSGGYLIEVDAYAFDNPPEPVRFYSQRQTPVAVKYPKDDEIVAVQKTYIENHYNTMESAVFSSSYTAPNVGYRRYIDVPSFIRHFLVGEISGNTDTYWSVYMSKKRNDDKFYFGPVWDFDLAFENDQRTYPINQKNDFIYKYGSAAGGFQSFVTRLLSDASMMNEIKSTWTHYRDNNIISAEVLCEEINSFAAEINVSQNLNFKRWGNLNEWTHQMWARGDYNNNVAIVRNYITERIAWLDNKLQYVPKLSGNEELTIENEQIVEIQYFTLTGVKIEKPTEKGIYIQKTIYDNGKTKTEKMMNKTKN